MLCDSKSNNNNNLTFSQTFSNFQDSLPLLIKRQEIFISQPPSLANVPLATIVQSIDSTFGVTTFVQNQPVATIVFPPGSTGPLLTSSVSNPRSPSNFGGTTRSKPFGTDGLNTKATSISDFPLATFTLLPTSSIGNKPAQSTGFPSTIIPPASSNFGSTVVVLPTDVASGITAILPTSGIVSASMAAANVEFYNSLASEAAKNYQSFISANPGFVPPREPGTGLPESELKSISSVLFPSGRAPFQVPSIIPFPTSPGPIIQTGPGLLPTLGISPTLPPTLFPSVDPIPRAPGSDSRSLNPFAKETSRVIRSSPTSAPPLPTEINNNDDFRTITTKTALFPSTESSGSGSFITPKPFPSTTMKVSSPSAKRISGIVLGTIFGILALAALLAFLYRLWRAKKLKGRTATVYPQEAYLYDPSDVNGQPQMVGVSNLPPSMGGINSTGRESYMSGNPAMGNPPSIRYSNYLSGTAPPTTTYGMNTVTAGSPSLGMISSGVPNNPYGGPDRNALRYRLSNPSLHSEPLADPFMSPTALPTPTNPAVSRPYSSINVPSIYELNNGISNNTSSAPSFTPSLGLSWTSGPSGVSSGAGNYTRTSLLPSRNDGGVLPVVPEQEEMSNAGTNSLRNSSAETASDGRLSGRLNDKSNIPNLTLNTSIPSVTASILHTSMSPTAPLAAITAPLTNSRRGGGGGAYQSMVSEASSDMVYLSQTSNSDIEEMRRAWADGYGRGIDTNKA